MKVTCGSWCPRSKPLWNGTAPYGPGSIARRLARSSLGFDPKPKSARRPAVRHLPTASLVLFAAAIGCGHQAAVPAPAHGYLTGAGGARIFYQVAGSGRDTIVVVHG